MAIFRDRMDSDFRFQLEKREGGDDDVKLIRDNNTFTIHYI